MKKLILANFKSNKSSLEVGEWLVNFLNNVDNTALDELEVSIAPSFISLEISKKMIDQSGKKVSLSAQNISTFPAGSYTGAISGRNLDGLNIEYAIVGHSERRKYFKETSRDVALKVEQSLRNNITPVVCVDEDYLEEQLNLISDEDLLKCIVAYEPILAIGSGKNVGVGKVQQVTKKIKRLAGDVKVIYGGSANEQNINEYLLVTDGAIIGTAALDANQFIKVVAVAKV